MNPSVLSPIILEKNHYVFHLFDVYGGGFSETLGFGTLEEKILCLISIIPMDFFKIFRPE